MPPGESAYIKGVLIVLIVTDKAYDVKAEEDTLRTSSRLHVCM